MEVEGRKIYSVRGFNNGVARWLNKLPTLWIEGEVTELRRQQRWASVFFTLKDPEDGATLPVQMPRASSTSPKGSACMSSDAPSCTSSVANCASRR